MTVDTSSHLPPKCRRWHRWPLLLLIALASLLCAVALLELVLRSFDLFGVNYPAESMRYRLELIESSLNGPDGEPDLDGTLFRNRRSTIVEFGGFTVSTNSLGFRGPEIEPHKPPGVYRILVLGDSVVFGWGVNDEETFVRRLERELNAQGGDRRYEVVNTGHPMYDSMQEAALLDREGLALDPDLVILVYVINDIEPTRDPIEAMLAGQQPDPASLSFGSRVEIRIRSWLPATTTLLDALMANLGGGGGPNQGSFTIEAAQVRNGEVGWQRSRGALRRIRDACKKRGIPLLILDHTLPEFPALETFCRQEKLRYHEFRFTGEELGMDIFNSLVDSHSNALGNELLLRKLKRILRQEKIVELR